MPSYKVEKLLQMRCRLISRAWQIAGTRYEDPKLAKRSECNLLNSGGGETSLEFYNCRTSEGIKPLVRAIK